MPAKDEVLDRGVTVTAVDAQPRTWCSWLNGTGWSRTTFTWVTYGERLTTITMPSAAITKNTAPKILTLEIVLVLG